MQKFENRSQYAVLVLRLLLAALIGARGWAHWFDGGTLPFGETLAHDFAGAAMLTMAVTALEAIGALFLAAGRLVFPIALAYVLIFASSIAFYHAGKGWYTSGADQDGAEYAVLLMLMSACMAYLHAPLRKVKLLDAKVEVGLAG